MKIRQKILTVAVAGATICSLSVGVRASLQPGTPKVGEYFPSPTFPGTDVSILGDLNQYFQALQTFLQRELSQILTSGSSLDQEIYSVVIEEIGSLGIPDPLETNERIYEQTQEVSEPGALATNPTFQAQAATDQARRSIAQAKIQATLGKEGQKQLEAEFARITQAASGVTQAAATAQAQNITQDVMKQIAAQNAQTASILQATYQETMQTRLATLQSNQTLLNISQNLDQQDWEETVNSAASATGLVSATAQFAALIESED